MTDRKLRTLNRRWRESGTDEDRLAYLKEEMRVGHRPSMELAVFHLRGLTPLITHRCEPSELWSVVHGEPNRPSGDPRTQAERRTYKSATGAYIIPSDRLGGALEEGSRRIIRNLESDFSDIVQLIDQELPLLDLDEEEPWEVDARIGRLPDSLEPYDMFFPKFNTWALKVWVGYNPDQVDIPTLTKIFQVAGRCVGIGSMSPRNKGPYGTFEVASYQKF